MNMTFRAWWVLAALAGLLTACGGGGGGAGSVAPPVPVTLSVTAQSVRTLAFDWQGAEAATRLELMEDPDGAAGAETERLLALPPAGSRSLAVDVFLPDRVNATFRLRACGEAGCVDSAPVGAVPLQAAIGYFKASNASAEDEFGQGVVLSADGRTLAVSAPFEDGSVGGVNGATDRVAGLDAGAVYVFRRANGPWMQEARLKAPHPRQGDLFGRDLALSADGSRLLVGAHQEDGASTGVGGDPAITGLADSGAAFVFDRSPDGRWQHSAYLKAAAPSIDGRLGYGVALSGDGLWAAAAALSGGRPEVHTFRFTGGAWVAAGVVTGFVDAASTIDDPYGDPYVGKFLSLDHTGRTLVLGVEYEDGGGTGVNPGTGAAAVMNAGAAYVFERSVADSWQAVAYLKPLSAQPELHFGGALSISADGRVLAVGAAPPGAALVNGGGEVTVFERGALGWTARARLGRVAAAGTGRFGFSLALSAAGDRLAVGDIEESSATIGLAPVPAGGSLPGSGAVTTFARQADGSWSRGALVKAAHPVVDSFFGWSVALSGDGQTLAVGALDESGASTGIGGSAEDQSARWAGAAYLY